LKGRTVKPILYYGFIFALIVTVGFFLEPDTAFFVELLPLSIGEIKLPDAICQIKSDTKILDDRGRFTGIIDASPFFNKQPTLRIGPTDRDRPSTFGGLENSALHSLKIRCATGAIIDTTNPELETTPDPTLSEVNRATLIVKPGSQIKLRVISQDVNENEVQTFSAQDITTTVRLPSGNEFTLLEFEIPFDKIQEKLIGLCEFETCNYKSWNKFLLSGDLRLVYEDFDFPSVTYKIHIPENSIVTYILLEQEHDGTGEFAGDGTNPEPEPPEDVPCEQTGDCNPKDPKGGENINVILDTFTTWTTCLVVGDYDCLLSQNYWGIYAIIILVGSLGIYVDRRARRQFNPIGAMG